MKKLFLLLILTAVFSCSIEESKDENQNFIDPDKECPEWDRNCNGTPDDQE